MTFYASKSIPSSSLLHLTNFYPQQLNTSHKKLPSLLQKRLFGGFRKVSRTVAYYGLKPPPYKLDALEPYVSQKTLEKHWGGHHRGYVDALNEALAKNDVLYGYTMDELVRVTYNNGNPFPEFNSAAQVWNHDFFWESMQPGGGDMPKLGVLEQIEKDFGSFTNFKGKFIEAALTFFGSGWIWLVLKREQRRLDIVKTSNTITSIVWDDIPIISLDVWEVSIHIIAQESCNLYTNVNLKNKIQVFGIRTIKRSNFYVRNYPISLAKALSFAEKVESLILGNQLHGFIEKLGFGNHIFTMNNLVKMYTKFGLLRDGLRVFHEMPERNIVSWTLLVSVSIQCGEFELGLEMYLQMMRSGFIPNEFGLGSVVKLCGDEKDSIFGLCNHCLALKIGMDKHPHVGSSILIFYAKLGDIETAESMFKCMENIDIGCWNAMIGGYTQCNYGFEAISMASSMQCEGIMMDKYSLISSLQGCSLAGDLNFGKQIHGFIFTGEIKTSTSVLNALINMYFKNDEIDSAMKVFRRMHDMDVVTWNTMFGNFSQFEDPKEVVSLYNEFMLTGLRPNHVTFSVLFRQCGELLDLDLGLQLCSLALHLGLFDEGNVTSSLIIMFSRCESMEAAQLVFDCATFRNTIIWNELISGYILNCCYMEAISSFYLLLRSGFEANECSFSTVLEACCKSEDRKMSSQIHGVAVKSGFAPHGYVCSALMKCYIKLGLLNESFEFINESERIDMVSWGGMISALVREGYNYVAINVLNSLMEAGLKPDEFILGSIFNSCANIAAHYQTKSMHSFIIKLGFQNHLCVVGAVLDAYAKCGDIKSAKMVFHLSSKNHDVLMYNSMIIAYAHHGLVSEAFEIFNKMKLAKLQPSSATFVSVLSACGHKGMVDLGCHLFKSMDEEYGLKPSPDNYGCLIDMLSRSGYLEDAKKTIETMPYPPWPAILRSLLSGCRTYGNRELGEWAAQKLLKLVPENDAAYALLFDFYCENGNWEDAGEVRRQMAEKTARKEPGYSWIEVWNHDFFWESLQPGGGNMPELGVLEQIE